MKTIRSIAIHRGIVCGIVFVLSLAALIAASTAAMMIQTETASGKVVAVTPDNVIELDDGFSYYPDRTDSSGSSPDIKSNGYWTIRYYLNEDNKRIYLEYAPGKNSLKNPSPQDKTRPRHLL